MCDDNHPCVVAYGCFSTLVQNTLSPMNLDWESTLSSKQVCIVLYFMNRMSHIYGECLKKGENYGKIRNSEKD